MSHVHFDSSSLLFVAVVPRCGIEPPSRGMPVRGCWLDSPVPEFPRRFLATWVLGCCHPSPSVTVDATTVVVGVAEVVGLVICLCLFRCALEANRTVGLEAIGWTVNGGLGFHAISPYGLSCCHKIIIHTRATPSNQRCRIF